MEAEDWIASNLVVFGSAVIVAPLVVLSPLIVATPVLVFTPFLPLGIGYQTNAPRKLGVTANLARLKDFRKLSA